MGLFEHWPYTNFHDLNLNWIISKIKHIETAEQSTAASEQAAAASADAAAASAESAHASAENAAASEESAGQSAESAQNYAEHIADPVGGLVTGWLDDNITPTTPPVDASLTIQGAAADAKATGDAIAALRNEAVPYEVKQALDNMFKKVQFASDASNEYSVFHSWASGADIVSISAAYNPGNNLIYDSDSLDSLRPYLIVTALFSDGTTAAVSGYTLSGNMNAGNNTFMVTFENVSTTFTALISHVNYDIIVGTFAWTDNQFRYAYKNVALNRCVTDPFGNTLAAGKTISASLGSASSTYQYAIGAVKGEDVSNVDNDVTEGTSKTILDPISNDTYAGGFVTEPTTFTNDGTYNYYFFTFKRIDNAAITAADKTAIKNAFTYTITDVEA